MAVDGRDLQRVAVGIGVVGQDTVLGVDRQVDALVGGAVVFDSSRGRVLHIPREVLRHRGAGLVGGGDGDGVDAMVTTLRSGLVQRAGNDAGLGVDGQAGRQALGRERQRIAGIDVGELARDVDRDDGLAVVVGLVIQRHARGQDRGVVGARDGDREGRRARGALEVGDRVRDRGSGSLVCTQTLERRARIERVSAIGIQRERATMGTRHRGADARGIAVDVRNMQGVAVRVAVVAQHAFGDVVHDQHVVLTGGVGVVSGDRLGVAHLPDKALRHRGARFVGGRHVDEVFALHAGVGVIGDPVGEGARERAGLAVEGQAAGQVVGRVRQHVAIVDVAEEAGDGVVDGITVHAALVVQRDGRGRVVRAEDRDRQRRGAGAAFAVRHRVGDRARGAFARGQILEVGAGIETVGTVGVQREGATAQASHGRADVGRLAIDQRHLQRVTVRIGVIGQHAVPGADVERGVFVGLALVFDGGGGRVLDVPREVLRHRGAALVGRRDGDRVDALVAALRGGPVQRAGNDAGGRIDRQARRQPGGRVGQRIAVVDVAELAGDVDRSDGGTVVAGLVGQRDFRRQRRGVVRARDGDRQGGGRRAALAVRHLVGD